MKTSRLTAVLLALVMTIGLAADSMADISSAAVLFLRIAPGSRAAGMGEAFVAIADDATATHWNPAGLGNYPLSDNWIQAEIPAEFAPISQIATLQVGGDRSYLDYEIWAITSKGLARYDNKDWSSYEVFSTRTDETVGDKVRQYFNIADDQKLSHTIERVAAANSRRTLEDISALRDRVLEVVPEDYDNRDQVVMDADSLVACYNLCRINWDRVDELEKRLEDGLKDETMSDTESDRVAVALERSRTRFLPEELKIPYAALFDEQPTSLASSGSSLLIGSSDGLARYTGSNWQIVTNEDVPSTSVSGMYPMAGEIAIATDSGLVLFDGARFTRLAVQGNLLPAGEIQAVGGRDITFLYAVVDGDLWRYDGRSWSNTYRYTVAVGESIEQIADRFSIYDSPADHQRFMAKYDLLVPPDIGNLLNNTPEEAVVATTDDSTMATEAPTEEPDSVDNQSIEEAFIETFDGAVQADASSTSFSPGENIEVPFVAGIKGRVNAIYVDAQGRVWLGTDHGVFYFDQERWQTPGYEEYTVAEGVEGLDAVIGEGQSFTTDEEREAYSNLLIDLNDLDDSGIEGRTLMIQANPAANEITQISGTPNNIMFATDDGAIEFDGASWSRSDLEDLSGERVIGINSFGNENWIASEDRVIIKGRGRAELSAMHVNWLPELADDLYYEFLSFVTPVRGWGTVGMNVTFISYGTFSRTGERGEELGDFSAFDIAVTGSYGTSLLRNLKGGVSAKVIYSRLSDQGAGAEQGSGTATGFALDVGLLWLMSQRLTWGLAVTNLGPKMSYIDAAQSDDLPRNLAIGVSYKLLQSDYNRLIVTAEVNKLLVGLDDPSDVELQQTVINGGAEFMYANLFAARAGYIYDQEGDIKTFTVGFGLRLLERMKFDFAYIPSQDDFSLANTLRISLGVML